MFRVYRGLCYPVKVGIKVNHEIRILIQQPVFHGKYPRVLFVPDMDCEIIPNIVVDND